MNGPRVVVLGSEGSVVDEPMGDGLTAIARHAVREAARAALHEVLRRAQGNRARWPDLLEPKAVPGDRRLGRV